MRKVDGIAHRVSFRRIHADELVAFAHLVRPQNLQVGALAPLLPHSDARNHLDERQRAAIENRQLEVVELDDGVVDAHADKRRKQVLSGRNQHALLHQTGGVADLGDVLADGGHVESVEIDAAKHDARSCSGGKDAEVDGSSAMEANATALDGATDCSFKDQKYLRKAQSIGYKAGAKFERGISATCGGEVGTEFCGSRAS